MKRRTQLTLGLALLALAPLALAQGGDIALLNVVTHGNTQEYSVKIQVLILMTLVGLLPTMVLMMTCFTRFIIVLSLLRQALGLQQNAAEPHSDWYCALTHPAGNAPHLAQYLRPRGSAV